MGEESGKVIQVLGTSSNSGKTTIAMALCRHLSNLGYKVAPFKSINMSLNSVSIPDGSEISRSIWLQAKAARALPDFHMNPFLLKPEGGGKSQVIRNGRSMGVFSIREYHEIFLETAIEIIREDLQHLLNQYDVVVAEGAGSPAEINIMDRDFANIAVSELWKTPALLVGDIDRGGVFASLYGTIKLMRSSELVEWLVINKMRGDSSLLSQGLTDLEEMTGKKVIGVVPYMSNITLPGEDSLDYANSSGAGKIAVIRYPHMENYSDVDPLRLLNIDYFYSDGTNLESLSAADLIILPGSKRVDLDLGYLNRSGLGKAIREQAKAGKRILGICGGYQMLGKTIHFGKNSSLGSDMMEGLGLLNVETAYGENKVTGWVSGIFVNGGNTHQKGFQGYEIHYGIVENNGEKPLLKIGDRYEGTVSKGGNVIGTNVHGLLENQEFLSSLVGTKFSGKDLQNIIEGNIERVTTAISESIDLKPVLDRLGLG